MTRIISIIQLQKVFKDLLYLFGCGIFLIIYSCKSTPVNTEKEIEAKTPVTVARVAFKTISETIDIYAVTTYLKKNIICSSTNGLVESVSVVQGDYVSRGKLLFTLKTREASALQMNVQSDSSLTFKGIIKVFSPEEGVISSISHQSGDFVQEGGELAVVSDQNSMVFILDVPVEQIRFIEKIKECSLKLPDGRVISGMITGKLPEMNVQNQTVSYIVNPAAKIRLPQNLIANASLIKTINTNALVLPKDAILGNETLTEYWVMKLINDTTAVRVLVRKGIEKEDEVEIIEPKFLPEDRILLTGNYGLPDTAAVIISK